MVVIQSLRLLSASFIFIAESKVMLFAIKLFLYLTNLNYIMLRFTFLLTRQIESDQNQNTFIFKFIETFQVLERILIIWITSYICIYENTFPGSDVCIYISLFNIYMFN